MRLALFSGDYIAVGWGGALTIRAHYFKTGAKEMLPKKHGGFNENAIIEIYEKQRISSYE